MLWQIITAGRMISDWRSYWLHMHRNTMSWNSMRNPTDPHVNPCRISVIITQICPTFEFVRVRICSPFENTNLRNDLKALFQPTSTSVSFLSKAGSSQLGSVCEVEERTCLFPAGGSKYFFVKITVKCGLLHMQLFVTYLLYKWLV